MRCLRRILQGRWHVAGSACGFQQASLSGSLPMAICAASLITRCNLHHALVKDVMTAEVLQIMDSTRINALPAVNAENELVGALDMHDLLRVGVV